MTYLWILRHHRYKFICNLLRITVQKPNPLYTLYITEFCEKFRKLLAPIQINSIKSRLLCNKNQLLYSVRCKFLSRCQKSIHRNTSVSASYVRYYTISAQFITTFCYLKICHRRICCDYSLRYRLWCIIYIIYYGILISSYRLHYLVIICRTNYDIDLWKFFHYLVLISL